jgi:hypothetical protein
MQLFFAMSLPFFPASIHLNYLMFELETSTRLTSAIWQAADPYHLQSSPLGSRFSPGGSASSQRNRACAKHQRHKPGTALT